MVVTEIEKALGSELPEGFQTSLVESDRLRQLQGTDPDNKLSGVVEDYNDSTLREDAVIRMEIQRIITAFQTGAETVELPATQIEFANLRRFAAYYKGDNDTPSGTIKDPKRADTDDIVFSFASPEVYEEISGQAQDTFLQPGLTSGNTLDLVGDAGVDETTNANGASLQLDADEMLYFTGDYVDLSPGQGEISKIQWSDVDGEQYGPDAGLFSQRLSSNHIFTGQGAWVKSTCDLDAKVYADGDAEVVPIAFYLGPGTKAPSLV